MTPRTWQSHPEIGEDMPTLAEAEADETLGIDCVLCGEPLTEITYCAADDYHHRDCGDQCAPCLDEAAREYADEQMADYKMYGPI